jgi:hypothetical protein
MMEGINELAKVLVNKKLMIFQKKLRDVKNIKCPLE